MLLGGLTLVLLALLRGRSLRIRRAHWPRLVAGGLLSLGAFNILLAFAQLHAATSRAAIVTFTMPIWTSLLARIVLGERLDGRRLVGLGLGLAGLAALGLPLWQAGSLSIGLLYALAGGVCWAAGTVVTKRYPVAAAPLAIAAWQLLIGAVAAGLGMIVFEGLPHPHLLRTETTVALAYHVVLAQALAYFLWFEVIVTIPAAIASLGTLIVPAIGVLGAVLFVGERPTASDLAGLVLIIAAAATALMPVRHSAASFRQAPSARR